MRSLVCGFRSSFNAPLWSRLCYGAAHVSKFIGTSLALLLLVAGVAPAASSRSAFVEAVEFPYYAYPPQLWERELVWLKNLGMDTVAFSIPWNWHQVDAESLDLAGRTSPRRDLIGFLRMLKRAGLRAWIRPVPPVKGWRNFGYPAGMESDRHALRKWVWDLESELAPFLAVHGGPIAFVEGAGVVFDAPEPPTPIKSVSATDPHALALSRQALAAGRGSLLWENVEDQLPPVGWEAPEGAIFHAGAVSLSGDERMNVTPLRRAALLWRYWGRALSTMQPSGAARMVAGRLPGGIATQQLVDPRGASALSVINQSGKAFEGALRVIYPPSRRRVELPTLKLDPSEALWLPVHVPLGAEGFCRDCSAFGNTDYIVYATAELNAVEYENGILAMEFAAPRPGEVVLQLSSEPSGPLLAAGRPVSFDWDDKTQRARLPIPAGKGPAYRVRIGLAIEPPDSSAFFVDAKRLVIGQKNLLETSYSSEQVAQRSRLRLPESFHAASAIKSPTEIEYTVDVPPDALHGEWAQLALESDGVLMSRASLQLLRPASVRVREAVSLHYGSVAELPVVPALVPVDAEAGREVSVAIHNNSAEIRNYVVEVGGEGLEFSPSRAEISIAGGMERDVEIRVFPVSGRRGLAPWRLHVTGAAEVDMPIRFLVIPRGETVAYSADLDSNGQPEWILENQRARAVFSAQDGGRWLEFVWKDSGLNLLPEGGALGGSGVAEVSILPDNSLLFRARDSSRTVRLEGAGAVLTVDGTSALPPETLHTEKKSEVLFRVTRDSPNRAAYALMRESQ